MSSTNLITVLKKGNEKLYYVHDGNSGFEDWFPNLETKKIQKIIKEFGFDNPFFLKKLLDSGTAFEDDSELEAVDEEGYCYGRRWTLEVSSEQIQTVNSICKSLAKLMVKRADDLLADYYQSFFRKHDFIPDFMLFPETSSIWDTECTKFFDEYCQYKEMLKVKSLVVDYLI